MEIVKIIHYHTDSKKVTKMKYLYADLVTMMDLKMSQMWRSKDEYEFFKKYRKHSEHKSFIKILRTIEKMLSLKSYETIRNIKEK